ncbi:related to Dik6, novel virulence factor [Ustilago trichophora]|uniref:Related to Dik6, novel virulence factor n=1 Tax=Ustilago trichophora TaxID=86804 RepID=A0A5C3EF43_9BASI|nr:related to Dik6, novel virulence factor [Ustilago trichophora]
MSSSAAFDLDETGRPLSLAHAYSPQSMTFLHRGQTQQEVVEALYKLIYAPETPGHRTWLLLSMFECLVALIACSAMILKKKSFGKVWIFTKRDSPFGSFYVTNAVFCLVLGVGLYLMAWNVTAIVIAAFSFADISSFEWWWVIPAPWWPILVCAWISIHGFVVGGSPRSPFSPNSPASRSKWYYLPVPKWPALVNATLVVPPFLFTISTFVLVGLSGRAYFRARTFCSENLPADILLQIHNRAKHIPSDFVQANDLASPDLIWTARRVAAAYLEVHRLVALNLIIFAVAAGVLWIPSCIYGLPNVASLVEHACSRLPEPLPPSCKTILHKTFFFITKGRPKSRTDSASLSINTWKMTVLAMGYVSLLVVATPAFGLIPIYIVANSFPHEVEKGDFTPTLRIAIIIVSVMTFATCTFLAFFCTVITLDPLFRSAIGLNLLRNQIPIDIRVIQKKSRHEERDSTPPDFCFKVDDIESDHGHHLGVAYKPSMSTLKSSHLEKDEAEYQVNDEADTAVVADVELGHRPHQP